ncbi:hypothetical protein, partial [Pseudomonas sp. MH10]
NFEALISKQGVQDGTTKAQIVSQYNLKALGFKVVEQGANTCSPLISGKVCNFYRHLHALADVNHDGDVSAEELRLTLRNPAFRNRWSKLITHHHTEWQTTADAANWQAFRDRLSHDPEWLRHESERINNLVFWDEVAEKVGLPKDGWVSYFHPVEFVGAIKPSEESKLAGKVTFDAEGSDTVDSYYFSRVIHWPGNDLSGVTLGRGYDMGSRSGIEIKDHMIAAGLDPIQASKICKANGLKGISARTFVENNKLDIGEITHAQQKNLFNITYPDYVNRAINNYNRWTAGEDARFEWDELLPAIKDILVDFVYQGFTQGANPMKAGMRNNIDELINYIENTPTLSQYEPGRQRANYLRKSR